MANLQNDIASGIATILSTSAFDAVLRESKAATDVVQTGYQKNGDPYGKYNGIQVVPGIPETPPETTYDDSALGVFNYDVEFDVKDLSLTNHETVNAMSQLMISKFGDNGTTLSANITDNGSNLLDGTQVTIEMDPPEIEPQDENGNVAPRMVYPLRVFAWHAMPLS